PVVFEGDVRLHLDPSASFAGALPAYSRTRYRLSLEMPRHLQGGFAYDVANHLATWSVDVQWTQWSAARGLGDPRARPRLRHARHGGGSHRGRAARHRARRRAARLCVRPERGLERPPRRDHLLVRPPSPLRGRRAPLG